MRILDLFSGLEGWSRPARAMGHDVVTLDLDPRFRADHVVDIRSIDRLDVLERDGPFDLILASPPCEAFSTGSIGRNWTGGLRAYVPKSDRARQGLAVMRATFALVDAYRDAHPGVRYVIENPRGMMRKLAPRPPTATTWYCRWGTTRAKPTDLWTNVDLFPPGAWPRCHNGADDHDAQSRYYRRRKELGQTGGTQGLPDAAARALIPPALATAVIVHVAALISGQGPVAGVLSARGRDPDDHGRDATVQPDRMA